MEAKANSILSTLTKPRWIETAGNFTPAQTPPTPQPRAEPQPHATVSVSPSPRPPALAPACAPDAELQEQLPSMEEVAAHLEDPQTPAQEADRSVLNTAARESLARMQSRLEVPKR